MANTPLAAPASAAETGQEPRIDPWHTEAPKYQVYLITNTETKTSYVGRTKGPLPQRLAEHIRAARRGSAFQLHRAIHQHGKENFVIQVLERNVPRHLINARERFWVTVHDTLKKGYNATRGGGGALGSFEPRRIRDPNAKRIPWNKGRKLGPLPQNVREKISVKLCGRRSPLRGRRATEETRRKLRENRLGPLNPAYGRKRPDLAQWNSRTRRVWIRKDCIEKEVPLSQISYFLDQGFEFGRSPPASRSCRATASARRSSMTPPPSAMPPS